MSYSPGPLVLDQTKPSPWNLEEAFLLPSVARGLMSLVPAWEGNSKPYDVIRREYLTPSGTPTWGVGSRGPALYTDSVTTNEGWTWPGSEWIPGANVTILIHKHKQDGTNRQSSAFGLKSADSQRIGAHLPWSDGNIYFDFGGLSGSNRLSVSGLTFGDDIFVFRAGNSGMAIWQNGVLVGSSATAVTRDNSPTQSLWLGNGNTVTAGSLSSDLAQFAIWAMWDRELAEAEIVRLSASPYALLRPNWDYLSAVFSSTSLFATGDGTIVDVVNENDAATPLSPSVDDDPASPDDNDWVNNAVDVT